MIGRYLHFGYSDILQMRISVMLEFVEMAATAAQSAQPAE